MDKKVRQALFQPLAAGTLSTVVPDFTVDLPGGPISAPTHLTCTRNKFIFTLHFKESKPACLTPLTGRVLTEADQLSVHGRIDGEIAFHARVFPPVDWESRSCGTSTVTIEASRIELTAETSDLLTRAELLGLLGTPPEDTAKKTRSFYAHLIFHGPKHWMKSEGTKVVTNNDFLGEAVSSSMDTHLFSGADYEGALIQQGEELHLHIRSKKEQITEAINPAKIVDLIIKAAAFVLGFQPWPTYRELRINRRVEERWLCPNLNLSQTYLAPVSERLWHLGSTKLLHEIIPSVAAGLGLLKAAELDRLELLLWHLRSSELSDLPSSTKLLILCAGLEGLMRLIAGYEAAPKNKKQAKQIWREACNGLHLSWDPWPAGVFDLWSKYRNSLAHGWLWVAEADDVESYFTDYPRLSCAFSTLVAAWCGYEGPIVANPLDAESIEIEKLKGPDPSLPVEPQQ